MLTCAPIFGKSEYTQRGEKQEQKSVCSCMYGRQQVMIITTANRSCVLCSQHCNPIFAHPCIYHFVLQHFLLFRKKNFYSYTYTCNCNAFKKISVEHRFENVSEMQNKFS